MTRTTAREIAMHLIYEMEYHDELPEELFQKVFEEDYYHTSSLHTSLARLNAAQAFGQPA